MAHFVRQNMSKVLKLGQNKLKGEKIWQQKGQMNTTKFGQIGALY